ncbi:MAG: GTP-binding protein [Mycobacterium leprae]
MEQRPIRNVGLLAHVDAGKTTTTEQMLFLTGRIRAAGSVDNGTAQTDWLDVERERGISVRMATTVLPWRETAINLVDTPGHVDFVAEVERSLQVLDGAVLVISAAEKVQSHTETLWHALRRLHIPTLLFVNKVDRLGVSIEGVTDAIRSELTDKAVVLQAVSGTEALFRGVEPIPHEQLLERMADLDGETLERYVANDQVPPEYLQQRLAALCQSEEAFPILFGAASKGIGVRELLDAIVDYLPAPTDKASDPVSGVVFKLDRDATMGRLAYVRLFGGELQTRTAVRNETRATDAKVAQVRKMYARHHEDVGRLTAGDIGVLCGLGDVRVGDVLGDPRGVPPLHRLAVPVLTVQVHAQKDADYPRLVSALQELTEEDPLLGFQWQRESRELHVQVMGAIQIEVLSSLLQSRFGVQARFDSPTVIYQETPATAGEGFVAYTMPKPCWAILRFAIEPLPRGSGLVYSSQVGADSLLPSYQNEVARRVPEALQQGLSGWQVTDLKVTLTYGEHHIYHTHPLDFVVATPMGIMDGLVTTGTQLMEPLYGFRLSVPEDAAGRVMGDLVQMRARFDAPTMSGGRFVVEGELPVATSLDYPVRLNSMTGGRGVLTTRFAGYQPAPLDVKATRDRTGVNPLDRAKYILSVRGAL